jgi:hypothetical protein
MRSLYSHAVATVLLIIGGCGVPPASGAGSLAPANNAEPWLETSETLNLTGAQEQVLWQTVDKQTARKQTGQKDRNTGVPLRFEPEVGAAVPTAIALRPWPSEVTGRIPALRHYEYAVQDSNLLIVDPADKKIVDVIRH